MYMEMLKNIIGFGHVVFWNMTCRGAEKSHVDSDVEIVIIWEVFPQECGLIKSDCHGLEIVLAWQKWHRKKEWRGSFSVSV